MCHIVYVRCCIILINYIVPVSEVAFSRDYAFALFDVLAYFVLLFDGGRGKYWDSSFIR